MGSLSPHDTAIAARPDQLFPRGLLDTTPFGQSGANAVALPHTNITHYIAGAQQSIIPTPMRTMCFSLISTRVRRARTGYLDVEAALLASVAVPRRGSQL